MPIYTMSFGGFLVSPNIGRLRNSFEMIGIYAKSIPTQMIYYHSFGYFSAVNFIRNNVC